MSKSRGQLPHAETNDLRRFPRRALTITLFAFLVVVPLAYSPEFDDFFYQPKLLVACGLLALAGLFWFAFHLADRRAAVMLHPVFVFASLFLLALAAATILSRYPEISLYGRELRSEGLLAFFIYAVTFFLFANSCDNERRLRTFLCALLVGAGIASAYGLFQFFGLDPLPRDNIRFNWWRAFAASGNPAFLSTYLLLALPFPLFFYLYLPEDRRRHSWLWLALGAIIFTCILATYHRGAWVGLAAGAVIATILMKWHLRRGLPLRLKRLFALVAVLLVCAVAFDRLAVAANRPSLIARASAGTAEGRVEDSTIRVRTYIWRATLPLIARYPVFGWGPDTMFLVFREEAPTPRMLGYTGRMRTRPDKPENLLLQVAYEGGFAALVPFIVMLGMFLVAMWRAVPKLDGFMKVAAMAILVGSVSHLAQQQFSFSTLSSSPVFWSLMGIGLALTRLARPTRPESTS